jgi:hypothetical protein
MLRLVSPSAIRDIGLPRIASRIAWHREPHLADTTSAKSVENDHCCLFQKLSFSRWMIAMEGHQFP